MENEEPFTWKAPGAATMGGAADDDPQWVVACDLDQVRSLIQDPGFWMECLSKATLNDKNAITLMSPFTMEIRMMPAKTSGELKDVEYLVQGIGGTSLITIRPVNGTRSHGLLSSWNAYWNHWAADPKSDKDLATGVPLHAVKKKGVGYGHHELSEDGDSEALRADKIAAFLIRAGTGFIDPTTKGLAINRILEKKCHTPKKEVKCDFDSVEATGQTFKSLTPNQLKTVAFTYMGTFGGAPCRACDNLAGNIENPGPSEQIVLDQVAVKCYRMEPTKPTS